MSKPIRVAVHDGLFCINTHCRFWISTSLTGPPFVDCCKRDCDNHKRGPMVLAPVPKPPFDVTMTAEWPDSPE